MLRHIRHAAFHWHTDILQQLYSRVRWLNNPTCSTTGTKYTEHFVCSVIFEAVAASSDTPLAFKN